MHTYTLTIKGTDGTESSVRFVSAKSNAVDYFKKLREACGTLIQTQSYQVTLPPKPKKIDFKEK